MSDGHGPRTDDPAPQLDELIAAVAANRRRGWERAADVLVAVAVLGMVVTASWATCRIEQRSQRIEESIAAQRSPAPAPCPCPTP